jgi:hypothetical protein
MEETPPMVRVTGAASFPGKIGAVSVSWPVATATADDAEVRIDIRPAPVKRFLSRFRDPDSAGDSDSLWAVRWDEIGSIDLARRSLVIRPKGRKGCRFAVLRRRRLIPLLRRLEARGVPVRPVLTTIPWFLNP